MIINEDSMFCSFIQIDETTYECYKCGISLVLQDSVPEPPLIPCAAQLTEYSASNIKKFILNDSNANSLCSEQEIDHRHSICESCPSFKDNSCAECGCQLSRDKVYMNKLALKDQSCPLGKW